MKYLLDTHSFLWSIAESGKLSKKSIGILKNPGNEVFVSSVTLWEIAIKIRLGKLEIEGFSLDELPGIIEHLRFGRIDCTMEDAIGYAGLKEPTHKDPFDRMLIQQCIRRGLTMISADAEFPKFVPYGLKLVW